MASDKRKLEQDRLDELERGLQAIADECMENIHRSLERISAEFGGQPDCTRCNSSGWVCENHDYIPWNGGDADCCDGAGAPCKDCNGAPNVMPRMEAGSRILWTAANGWAN